MPGYNIVGINSNSIIPSLGAIHCIVKEVGAFDPVFISHPKMDPVVAAPDSIRIQAALKTNSGIADAFVYWTADTTMGFDLIPMETASEDTFIAYIPQQINGTEIFYYISATSNNGKTITKPLPAPAGYYRFIVENNVTFAGNVIQPEEIYLSQNYPNPFNPTTTIKYQLPEFSFVTLKVYDVLGSEIALLVNEEKPMGSYEVEFDASKLSSGVYFYRLQAVPNGRQAGSFVVTKKMVLLR